MPIYFKQGKWIRPRLRGPRIYIYKFIEVHMSITAWKDIDWSLTEQRIFRYQTRIYKAARNGNISKVKCVQKRLLSSLDAKLMAVRRVTTLNKGRLTPGVDKQIYVTDIEKIKLVKHLRLDGKALPIRRVYIPKPGKSEKRPLGIPTVRDRAKQALCKLALEPEWEARFEANSYGFRPGRSCQDAMEAIFSSLRNHSKDKEYHKYVLDADISKCFDQIDHTYLIKKINTLPEMEVQINAWLKAGILEELTENTRWKDIPENTKGTPQGGIISPLLSNIALHGMENHMKNWICTKPSFAKTNKYSKDNKRKSIAIIRYADDFVIIHKDKNIICEAKEEISRWLLDGPRLILSEEKTSIRNTNNGFDFLGFTCTTITRGNIPRAKIYPSRSSQARLLVKVRKIVINNRSASSYNLIHLLRPVIIGWANYFRTSECSSIFGKLTHLIFQKLRAWAFRRDTRNGRKKVKEKYFPSNKTYNFDGTKHQDNWILNGEELDESGTIKKNWLPHIVWVKSTKWIKIKEDYSTFNGDNLYWGKRTMNQGNWNIRQRTLIRAQKGFCPYCKTLFLMDSVVEIDHIIPISKSGKDVYSNLQLLHKHCHINKTREDNLTNQPVHKNVKKQI
jgi:RNA-directed DNA polymerase